MSYFAVQVRTGQEERVVRMIYHLCSLEIQKNNMKVIAPQMLTNRSNKSVREIKKTAITPGYIYIQAQEITDGFYYMLRSINSVIRVLREKISYIEMMPVLDNRKQLLTGMLKLARQLSFYKTQKSSSYSSYCRKIMGLGNKLKIRSIRWFLNRVNLTFLLMPLFIYIRGEPFV